MNDVNIYTQINKMQQELAKIEENKILFTLM